MGNSALITKILPVAAKNYSAGRSARGGKISEITLHHAAGILTVEGIKNSWKNNNVSSTYGAAHKEIALYVAEADVPHTNGNWAANLRAVTIEIANSGLAPNWPVADDTLETVIKLVADIAKRNSLGTLVPGKNLTWHSVYAATACPGPYLLAKMQYIADEANKINNTENAGREVEEMQMSTKPVKMQLGPMSGGDLDTMRKLLDGLKIAYTEDGGYIKTADVSTGDQNTILQKAVALGLGFEPLVTTIADCIPRADYDAMRTRAETAEKKQGEYLLCIENVKKAVL
ncbi:MAG: N-acetylmuramoyl-L-alanine amidase [Oscillospiraceae bacterium]